MLTDDLVHRTTDEKMVSIPKYKYDILTTETTEEMVVLVQDYLDRHWTLAGSLTVMVTERETVIIQPVILQTFEKITEEEFTARQNRLLWEEVTENKNIGGNNE